MCYFGMSQLGNGEKPGVLFCLPTHALLKCMSEGTLSRQGLSFSVLCFFAISAATQQYALHAGGMWCAGDLPADDRQGHAEDLEGEHASSFTQDARLAQYACHWCREHFTLW